MKNINKKLLTLTTPYATYKVSMDLDAYVDNDRIAVLLAYWEENVQYPFATLTVNIPDFEITGDDCNFVDTNNLPYICKFLEENNLAQPTYNMACSGYCVYPEYQFNLDEIKKYI